MAYRPLARPAPAPAGRTDRARWPVGLLGALGVITALALPSALLAQATAAPWQIDTATASRLGQRIWANEGKGDDRYLMWWNEGEAFASLGIGHFIWYPVGTTGAFRQSFPALVEHLRSEGIALPPWLLTAARQGCPWPDRHRFFASAGSPRFEALATVLRTTIAAQARFIASGLGPAYRRLTAPSEGERAARRAANFERLARSPGGLYALLDYLNFKGDGTLERERYAGQGWGLAQVLDAMPTASSPERLLEDFVSAARQVLARRVANSPPERDENRWLAGWNARLSTYLEGE